MKKHYKIPFILFLLLVMAFVIHAQNHPNLILTQQDVNLIRKSVDAAPLFEQVLKQTQSEVDQEIELGILVPMPKDMAGGYTHERHKRNFFILQKAGNLYQITGEEKYAVYIRDVFLAYAEIYPKLELHPTNRSYATGKIFWQCLNDANWLVYCSQAYDCIYNFLSADERKLLETQLFRPFADFISKENPKFFNRIHNHSTWANAAVGMMGLAMNDEELIQRALYGLKEDGLDNAMMDNDGGFIKIDGVKQAGFLAQLDFSFSPDGYFTEGPYYLRYAMTPFLLFSKALANNRPDLEIYAYRDSILRKAVYSLLYQTDAQGQFFPINDAQKGMSWRAREVVAAVDIAYEEFGKDPTLLAIAEKQARVLLDGTGYKVARDIAKQMTRPFKQKPIAYRDGADGSKGGVGILRMNEEEELCAVFKYSAHGMGHGHFDKLSYSFYDGLGEIIQDYGAARWVNIDQKGGGRYLPENKTFAKQSIAHNTLVLNEQSHYEGSVKLGEANHPDLYFFDASNPAVQVISAKEVHAYPGTEIHRTLLLIKDENLTKPLLIDIFRANAEQQNQYDLPIWFQGHLLQTNFKYEAELNALKPLGKSYGYQHIWKEAQGKPASNNASLTWFNNGKFFTMTSYVSEDDDLILGRAGANDPEFNLRHDPCFILRKNQTADAVFISVIQSHGTYNPVSEIPLSPFSSIESIDLIHDGRDYTIFSIKNKGNIKWTIMLSNKDANGMSEHEVKSNGTTYKWKGVINIKKR
ncbi:MAG: heparinase II/III family protein [Bacteroidota bacterium]